MGANYMSTQIDDNLTHVETPLPKNVDPNDNSPLDFVCQMPKNRGCKAELFAFVFGFALLLTGFSIPPVEHNDHGQQNRASQAGLLLWFILTFLVAEMIRRICLFAEEVTHFKTRYDGSLSRLILHVFGLRYSVNLVTFAVLLSLGFMSQLDPMVVVEISSHWPLSAGLAGTYLILLSVVKITENLVDCNVLLDEKALAIGHGLAYSYYYGYLKIILPATETSKSLRDRAAHFEFEERIQLATKKLLILIPDTCFCTPSLQDMAPPGQIERVKKLEDVVIARAGIKGRPYSNTVYLVQPEGKRESVYVLLDMPAILYVLYEMNTVGLQNFKLSSFERTQQAQAFYRVLSRLLQEDPSCKDMYEIIFYKDQNVNLADLIYCHVQKMGE